MCNLRTHQQSLRNSLISPIIAPWLAHRYALFLKNLVGQLTTSWHTVIGYNQKLDQVYGAWLIKWVVKRKKIHLIFIFKIKPTIFQDNAKLWQT